MFHIEFWPKSAEISVGARRQREGQRHQGDVRAATVWLLAYVRTTYVYRTTRALCVAGAFSEDERKLRLRYLSFVVVCPLR